MSVFYNIKDKLLSYFNKSEKLNSEFIQYHHAVKCLPLSCSNPCPDCLFNDLRIFANDGTQPPVKEENHLMCHCYYREIKQKPVGSISKMGYLAPDVYLKKYGCLPDYYITKEEAIEKYGWIQGKNTIAGKAPGKMIGGDIFDNRNHILPEKESRIWYECDIDYESGRRNTKRLYYSNDGLMFYSESHNDTEVIQIK